MAEAVGAGLVLSHATLAVAERRQQKDVGRCWSAAVVFPPLLVARRSTSAVGCRWRPVGRAAPASTPAVAGSSRRRAATRCARGAELCGAHWPRTAIGRSITQRICNSFILLILSFVFSFCLCVSNSSRPCKFR